MPAADSDVVASDRLCVRCGYNLRGLQRRGRCPECNTPVSRSLRTKYLASRNQRWLRDVRDGAIIVSAAYSVGIVKQTLVHLPRWNHLTPGMFQGIDATGVHLTLYAIECAGIWLLLKPEPLLQQPASIKSATWIRGFYVLGFLASVAYRFLLFPYFQRDVSRAWARGESLLFMGVEILLFNYLASLARRIPDLRLTRQFFTLSWLAPLGTAVGSLTPSILLELHFWSMVTSTRLSWNKPIQVRQAPLPMLCAYSFGLAISGWTVFVLLRFVRAIKSVMKSQSADVSAGVD